MLEELNVKAIRYVSEAEELVDYEVKPNFRALGPRFGSRMPEAAKAIAAAGPRRGRGRASTVARASRSQVGGKEESLGPEDLSLVMLPRGGYQLERQANYAVALKVDLDEELLREGAAREVVHAIQIARKGAGLQVEDRIELTLFGDDALLEAVREHADYVSGRDARRQPRRSTAPGPRAPHTETARIDGSELGIALRRAG